MGYQIYEIQNQIEAYINSRFDGGAVTLGDNFKIYYIATLIDKEYITNNIKKVYFNSTINFYSYFTTIASKADNNKDFSKFSEELSRGYVIAIYNEELWEISDASKRENRGVTEISMESSFEGGMESFIEDIDVNINLIRQYYHQPNLMVNNFSVGTLAHNNLSVLYDDTLVDKNLLNSITKQFNEIKVPVVQSLNGLQQILWDKQVLIPRLLLTQRPDRAIKYLSRGKIIVFINGTAKALIIPVNFHDFLSTVDDIYMLPIPALFLIFLRYFALFISIYLPAAYIAITSYNPEILRVQLAISISASRSGVPYPSFIEVTLMLLMMEFLVEGSLRLPKPIGSAATTVGGLILGQAATQANLVSNIMVIIVAAVAISNFMIPTVSMNLTVRIMKYLVVFLTSFTGTYGLYLSIFCTVFYIFSIYTFNFPYLAPVNSINLKSFKTFFKKGH
jgi:hypothetical protein